jgi:hypothetical protein
MTTLNECTCAAKDMPFGRCCKTPTSASVIAGLEMALSQADSMIERQQHVMQRAMDAWDTTTHQKSGDGRLWQCMEELRGEIGTPPTTTP